MGRYDLSTTTIGALLDDPAVVEILQRHYPSVTTQEAALQGVRDMPAEQGFQLASAWVGPDLINEVRREIEAL